METNKITDCILLVDDDPLNSFINSQLLSRLEIASTIKTTQNALEAVDFIRQCCILEEGELNRMLIFMDLHSNAYNGMELLLLINSMTDKVLEKVEIIILTSSPDKGHSELGDEYQILGVIEKPLTSDKLKQLLAQRLQVD